MAAFVWESSQGEYRTNWQMFRKHAGLTLLHTCSTSLSQSVWSVWSQEVKLEYILMALSANVKILFDLALKIRDIRFANWITKARRDCFYLFIYFLLTKGLLQLMLWQIKTQSLLHRDSSTQSFLGFFPGDGKSASNHRYSEHPYPPR